MALVVGAGAFVWRALGNQMPFWAFIVPLTVGTGSLLASWWLAMRKTNGITEPEGKGEDDGD